MSEKRKEQNATVKGMEYEPVLTTGRGELVKIGWADAIENLDGWHTEQRL